jgi:hypothetical protein
VTSVEAVDVRQLINQSALSSWQKRLIALCFIVVALDGMDIALMGFIAPTLKTAWGVSSVWSSALHWWGWRWVPWWRGRWPTVLGVAC